MRKLKLLLVLLVCGRAWALLHPGDDLDVWQHGLRQQAVLAGGNLGQQRSVVPLGGTLGSSFSLQERWRIPVSYTRESLPHNTHTRVLKQVWTCRGQTQEHPQINAQSQTSHEQITPPMCLYYNVKATVAELRPSTQTSYLIRLSTCFSYAIKRLFPVLNPSIYPSSLHEFNLCSFVYTPHLSMSSEWDN